MSSLDEGLVHLNESIGVSNRSTSGEEESLGLAPVYILWTCGFSFIVIVGTAGNGIVLWIVLCHRRMWNTTNYLLVNLSIVDLLMTVFNTIFNFIYMRDKNWIFGHTYCIINNFVAYLTVSASVLTLVSITFDRYRAILYPLKPKLSKWFVRGVILGIWCASSLISLPAILYSQTFTHRSRTICILVWPDGLPHISIQDYVYNVIFFVTTYVLPMILMAFCYTRMGKHLWGSRVIGEETPTLLRNYQNKKRVVKMFFTIVTIFGICWCPYHVYFIYVYHDNSIVNKPYIQHVYLGFYWLAMANSIVNPIVYFWMNIRFRKYYFKIFLFLPNIIRGKKSENINWNDGTNIELNMLNSCQNSHHGLSVHRTYSSIMTSNHSCGNRLSIPSRRLSQISRKRSASSGKLLCVGNPQDVKKCSMIVQNTRNGTSLSCSRNPFPELQTLNTRRASINVV